MKLYRDLLDDPEWHELDGESAKTLVMLWLIASEDETKQGTLPDKRRLCFRLRISERDLEQRITKLSHWLERDDINPISERYQSDAPERAGEETETETEPCSPSASGSAKEADDGFADFWLSYPRRVAKADAAKAWKRVKPKDRAAVMAALDAQKSSDGWTKDAGKFVPYPASWLNGRRWEDERQGAGQAGNHTADSVFAGAV